MWNIAEIVGLDDVGLERNPGDEMSFERQILLAHVLLYILFLCFCWFQSSLPDITKCSLHVQLCSRARTWTWHPRASDLIWDSVQTVSVTLEKLFNLFTSHWLIWEVESWFLNFGAAILSNEMFVQHQGRYIESVVKLALLYHWRIYCTKIYDLE